MAPRPTTRSARRSTSTWSAGRAAGSASCRPGSSPRWPRRSTGSTASCSTSGMWRCSGCARSAGRAMADERWLAAAPTSYAADERWLAAAPTSYAAGIPVADIEPGSPDAGAVAHYGDPMREQRTLSTTAGLVDRSHRGVLAIPGDDRLTWLHSLTTQHLTALKPWQGTELLVLSPHGHVEHHAVVADDGTTRWLDPERGAAGPLLDFMTRMRFLMRVEPADVSADWALLSLVGPAAALPGIELAPPAGTSVPGPKFASADVPARPT